ncbi:SRPBCC family protein [Herbihabitans rhizosphaerae]|uniref:SRPBCC family protein n=1 Tax=Herbihabitans rhizosphaerae TaxID=1872711 RepID=UPI001F5FC841|nr:SRPBCC family protein [Herbihabitans rhizosphaerae]
MDIEIDASPSRVWPLVTDIELPTRFSPELKRVEWLDGATSAALGASFVGHNRNERLGGWRTVSRVVELEAEQVFAWAVFDPDSRFGSGTTESEQSMALWRFTLEPSGGSTRVRLAARLGPGRSGLKLAIETLPYPEEQIIEYRLADLRGGMEATLTGLKRIAEGAAH